MTSLVQLVAPFLTLVVVILTPARSFAGSREPGAEAPPRRREAPTFGGGYRRAHAGTRSPFAAPLSSHLGTECRGRAAKGEHAAEHGGACRELRSWGAPVASSDYVFEYDEVGRNKKLTYPGGLERTQAYDHEGRLKDRCYSHANGPNQCYHAVKMDHDAQSNQNAPDARLVRRLEGRELASVVFVRSYVQLEFDGIRLSLFVWPVLVTEAGRLSFGEPGYRDGLCALIGLSVVSTLSDSDSISVRFANGAELRCLISRDVVESMMFNDEEGNEWFVS
ncbi:hypothetical protein BH09MYX1_BH09MYX1_59780 [soil metagenome]